MTKNEPGKFDCYSKSAPDEPLFTLRAKDPIAPWLIRIWRFIRAGEVGEAEDLCAVASDALHVSKRPLLGLDTEKSREAAQVAARMEAWLEGNSPPVSTSSPQMDFMKNLITNARSGNDAAVSVLRDICKEAAADAPTSDILAIAHFIYTLGIAAQQTKAADGPQIEGPPAV